jgi:hypothetical protein
MALLGTGEIKAATLPEPFGTIAVAGGAVIIVDDSRYPEYGNSVISFRKTLLTRIRKRSRASWRQWKMPRQRSIKRQMPGGRC